MRYGTIVDYIDDGKTIKQVTTYFREGREVAEHRRTYSERKRVNNQLEEAAEYHAFSKRYHQDPTMLSPSIAIEGKEQWAKGNKDHYDVILTYMQVVEE